MIVVTYNTKIHFLRELKTLMLIVLDSDLQKLCKCMAPDTTLWILRKKLRLSPSSSTDIFYKGERRGVV